MSHLHNFPCPTFTLSIKGHEQNSLPSLTDHGTWKGIWGKFPHPGTSEISMRCPSSWWVVQQSLNFILLKSVDLDRHFWLCRYLLQTLWSRERLQTLFFFNNFFFQELVEIDTSYKQSRAAFERVKKWTKEIPIFQKDYIFIPVNLRWHSFVAVRCCVLLNLQHWRKHLISPSTQKWCRPWIYKNLY